MYVYLHETVTTDKILNIPITQQGSKYPIEAFPPKSSQTKAITGLFYKYR